MKCGTRLSEDCGPDITTVGEVTQQFQFLQSTGAVVARESALIVSIAGVSWKEQPSRRRLYAPALDSPTPHGSQPPRPKGRHC